MTASSVAEAHGVACAVSSGQVSDYLRVVRSGTRRIIAMADGHTCGWDSGQVALSGPVLDAVVRAVGTEPQTPYRHVSPSSARLFEAARAAFLGAAEAHPEDDAVGGPAAQLTILELEGTKLRASWLARMELCVFRDAVVHRVTRKEPSSAIERTAYLPATVELTLEPGDLVTLSCRRWVGHELDRTRSELLASLVEAGTTAPQLLGAMLERWAEEHRAAQQSRALIGEFRLILAAVRV